MYIQDGANHIKHLELEKEKYTEIVMLVPSNGLYS